jgi:hypothetical protein
MNRTYDWEPPLGEEFPERLDSKQAKGLITLARSDREDDTNDLVEMALTKGKAAPRLAIEAIAAERNRAQAQEFEKIERRLLLIAWITAGAALAQAVTAVFTLWR